MTERKALQDDAPPVSSGYEVGYGKPPVGTRFRPGQSGNRKGRPRGVQNFSTVIEKELNSRVTVTENGRRKQVRKKDVIARQLVNKAATGDIKATTVLLNESRGPGPAAAGIGPATLTELVREDHLVLRSMLRRLHQNDLPTEEAPGAEPVRLRVQLRPEGDET